ncbi:response regulator transcription factor [Vibrio sp. JC009]|uniref:response regulator transcription factor n=1 Tax=Vibrio sp. JC009 TaxID=2912314 RepID=UPI0023B08379|nr:response regulator transcription factor [Vibrio sp. JC009]WED23024.1 response regulator transcription factor [Vibrio sp. JC009]
MNDELIIDVLLIEDDKELAIAVADYLKYENIRCDHAYNGHSGFNLAQGNSYDVILLDLMLPTINGLTVCQNLRQNGSDVPILMLTAKDTLEDKEAGFNAGTDDYLVKPFAMKELALRIKALAKRKSSQSKKLVVADLELDLESRSVTRGGEAITLTRINLQLLEMLMRDSPNIVSRAEIEEKLWPDDPPESNNLKVQLYQLRQKIDKPFTDKLLETISGLGFRIRDNKCGN